MEEQILHFFPMVVMSIGWEVFMWLCRPSSADMTPMILEQEILGHPPGQILVRGWEAGAPLLVGAKNSEKHGMVKGGDVMPLASLQATN